MLCNVLTIDDIGAKGKVVSWKKADMADTASEHVNVLRLSQLTLKLARNFWQQRWKEGEKGSHTRKLGGIRSLRVPNSRLTLGK